MGEDFMGFLTNLVQVFPSLKTRPFYLMGEVSNSISDSEVILTFLGDSELCRYVDKVH